MGPDFRILPDFVHPVFGVLLYVCTYLHLFIPDKNVVVRFAKTEKPVKTSSDRPFEKKLKRISRLHSSSSSADELNRSSDREKTQIDKESGEADTDTEEEEVIDKDKEESSDEVTERKKRRKKESSQSDNSEEDKERKRNKKRKKEKRKRSGSSGRDSSELDTKSDSRQFKRSLSADASKFGNKKSEKSSSFSGQTR